jgi:hypothetical protein
MGLRLGRLLVAPVVLLMAVSVGSTLWIASPAAATGQGDHHGPPPYGPQPCRVMVQVKPPNVDQGGTITVKLSGRCFNDIFTVSLMRQALGTVLTDAKGKGSNTFALPCSVTAGTRDVFAVDAVGNSDSRRVRVRSAACPSSLGRQKGRGTQADGHQSGGPSQSGGQHQSQPTSDLRLAGVDTRAGVPVGAAALGVAGLVVLRVRKRRGGNWG